MEETCLKRGRNKLINREQEFNQAIENTQKKIKDIEDRCKNFI